MQTCYVQISSNIIKYLQIYLDFHVCMRYGVVHLADLAAFGHSPTCEKKATSSGSWHEHRKQPIDLKVPVRSCILWKNHLFDLICYFTHLYAIVGSLASSTSFSPTSRKLVCLLFLTEEFFGPHQSLELWEASLHIEPDPMGQGGQGKNWTRIGRVGRVGRGFCSCHSTSLVHRVIFHVEIATL